MWGRAAFILALALGLSGCASKFKTYDGPQVTRVVVMKGERQMYLLHQDAVLKAYRVDLGFAPQGDKKVRGDGRTPEGSYLIDRRNPNSLYHLSIGVSYPNVDDMMEARSLAADPGGDIFIHGHGTKRRQQTDWTAGCIAITNKEIEDVYAMVRDGTPIDILP